MPNSQTLSLTKHDHLCDQIGDMAHCWMHLQNWLCRADYEGFCENHVYRAHKSESFNEAGWDQSGPSTWYIWSWMVQHPPVLHQLSNTFLWLKTMGVGHCCQLLIPQLATSPNQCWSGIQKSEALQSCSSPIKRKTILKQVPVIVLCSIRSIMWWRPGVLR